jgi:predicted TIM-barrel fold metal-dependent hydrolase
MTYAQDRILFDADSHIMELPDFLIDHMEDAFKATTPKVPVPTTGTLANLMDEARERRGHPEGAVAQLVALGDELISGPKGYMALGAFNPKERVQALNQLGFKKQLVFATFSAGMTFRADLPDAERYARARAHNKGMAEFCNADARLMGVALVPTHDPVLALETLNQAIELGLRAAWVPHKAAGGRSPGHTDFDPLWARMAQANIPFMLHVGGDPLQIDPAWMNTGRPVPTDWLGGGENVRGKDMTSLHHASETFICCLVLDGVLQRHPTLRGGVIELGAGWVPAMLRRLDWIADIWKKSEADLASLTRKPSQMVIDQLAFTPYVYEDVGAMIRESDPRLYMFSSDYPHTEGGRQPLARFGATMQGIDEAAVDKFYNGNFARLFESV